MARYMHYRGIKFTGEWAEPGWTACIKSLHPNRSTKDRERVTCPECKDSREWRVGPRERRRTIDRTRPGS